MGTISYIANVAIPSVGDLLEAGLYGLSNLSHAAHSSLEIERNATKRGDEYLKKNMHIPKKEE